MSSKGILPTELHGNGIEQEIIDAVENAAAVGPTLAPIAAPAPASAPAPAPAPAAAPEAPPEPRTRRYCANIFPGDTVEIDTQFAEDFLALEGKLGMPLWILAQNGTGAYSNIDHSVFWGFFERRHEIEGGKPAALLIESSGGDAHFAYKIVRLFQRRSNALTAVVLNYAKSAATLMVLGASNLVMAKDAELGPLDVQMFESEREEVGSALNAVQSLERINAFSMSAIDQLMPLLMKRTGKKLDTILPLVLSYMSNFVRPVLEKIDTVDLTKKSRELKVAEEYAIRLMTPHYDRDLATKTARALVESFPTHGFVIDREEAERRLRLKVTKPNLEMEKIIDRVIPRLDTITAVGRIVEMQQ